MAGEQLMVVNDDDGSKDTQWPIENNCEMSAHLRSHFPTNYKGDDGDI